MTFVTIGTRLPLRLQLRGGLLSLLLEEAHHEQYALSWSSERLGLSGVRLIQRSWPGDLRELMESVGVVVGDYLSGVDSRLFPTTVVHCEVDRRIDRAMEECETRRRGLMRQSGGDLHFIVQASMDRLSWQILEDLNRTMLDFLIGGPPDTPKARELLRRHLSPAQRAELEQTKSFKVVGQDGRVYTIRSEWTFNVSTSDGTRYCCQTTGVPLSDQMLTQKLLLETDVATFRRHANVSRGGSFYQRLWEGRLT